MRYVIAWVKANPWTLASALVVLVCLGINGWLFSAGSAFREKLEARSREIQKIRGYMSRPVEVPADKPNAPPETVNTVVNTMVIDQLSAIYGKINDEYEKLFKLAVEVNQQNHEVLAEGLFPSTDNPGLPFDARQMYVNAFEQILRPYDPDVSGPRLNAGMPPTQEEIGFTLQQFEEGYVEMRNGQLTPQERDELEEEKKKRLIEILRGRAESLNLYAIPDRRSQEFPFQIAAWAGQDRPEMYQLWEGQLELWIQEDIARAIAIANRVTDANANIINAPVKRLLKVEVIPGYVGLHTLGGAVGQPGSTRGSTGAQRGDGSYPPPFGGLTNDVDQRVSDNFHVGPTGRVSNALYDVRHARVVAVVDFQKLPELFRALSRVNFMTVLNMQVTDVDEYDALAEGFVYGSSDAVEVDMVIETLWMREWTEPLMPDKTREYVGIDEPEEPAQQQFDDPYGGYGDPYGGYGGYGGDPYGGGYGPPAP